MHLMIGFLISLIIVNSIVYGEFLSILSKRDHFATQFKVDLVAFVVHLRVSCYYLGICEGH